MHRYHLFLQLVMSAILLGIVACLCSFLPQLGYLNAVIAITLLLSLLVGAANGYCYITRATKTSLTFDPKGWIVWILGRRWLGYIIILILAFLSSLCFVIHVPSLNDVSFGFIFLTVPVFAGVYYCVRKIFEGQSVDWMICGRSLFWSLLTTPFLMVVLYGLFLNYSGLVPVYDNLQAAIDAQPTPWDNTHSVLLRNAGEWSVLWGACRDFGFGQLLRANRYITIIFVSIGYWALFFNICSLLACVFVPLREYKRLVLPLTPSMELPQVSFKQFAPLGGLLIVLVPLCFALFNREQEAAMIPDPEPTKVVLIKIGDSVFNKDVETRAAEIQERLHEELIRELAGHQGKLEGLQGTLTEINAQREELLNRLEKLKNNTFLELKKYHEDELFPRIERNVDAYLDWYYSRPRKRQLSVFVIPNFRHSMVHTAATQPNRLANDDQK